MKTTVLTIALLMSSAAIAQPTDLTADTPLPADTSAAPAPDTSNTADQDSTATALPAAGTETQQPDNSNPRHDARGIAVISDAAVIPAGYNGVSGAAVGGPEVDPATGQTISDTAAAPPCSKTVTDHCLQTYERHRSRA